MELISREEVLNVLNDSCNQVLKVYDKKYHSPIRTITITATEDIKKLPSQWVEINEAPFGKVYQNSFVTFLSTETYDEVKRRLHRPKGKWIMESDFKVMGEGYIWYCSECRKREYVDSRGVFSNYCSACGADMRGEVGHE